MTRIFFITSRAFHFFINFSALLFYPKHILSLAVNFHPHDVAFLLIDYKGGGMANLFKNLPHLLGTITNLDGAQSMRRFTVGSGSSESLKSIISTNIKRNLKTGKQLNPCPISSSSRMSSQSSRSISLTLSRSWYPSLGSDVPLGST